jgi:hypothetical protein
MRARGTLATTGCSVMKPRTRLSKRTSFTSCSPLLQVRPNSRFLPRSGWVVGLPLKNGDW